MKLNKVLLGMMVSLPLFSSGYKIPENSLNSLALGAAYVANANGADSSYFNPANMAFNEDKNYMELGLIYLKLNQLEFKHAAIPTLSAENKKEDFFIPSLHFASKNYDGLRFGFSVVVPAGLTQRWEDPLQAASATEFTLNIVELNPTIGYKINPYLSIGGGVRALFTDGIVKSDSAALDALLSTGSAARDMEGDALDYGYNLAVSFRPNDQLSLATTYRSKVDLQVEGNAKLYLNGALFYNNVGKVTAVVPATLDVALAYKVLPSTVVEFVYEKTYWSAYKELDFQYLTAQPVFDAPVAKNWKDTNTYRLGVTHTLNDKVKLMAGYGIDESPIPDATLGFDLADSDSKLYSLGVEYKHSEQNSFGLGYLYTKKESRFSTHFGAGGGEVSNGGAHLVSLNYKLTF